jgi:hypothetical protein
VKILKIKKFIEKMNMERLSKSSKLVIHKKEPLAEEFGQLYVE